MGWQGTLPQRPRSAVPRFLSSHQPDTQSNGTRTASGLPSVLHSSPLLMSCTPSPLGHQKWDLLHQPHATTALLLIFAVTSFDLLGTEGQLPPKAPEVPAAKTLRLPLPLPEFVQHLLIQARVSFWSLIQAEINKTQQMSAGFGSGFSRCGRRPTLLPRPAKQHTDLPTETVLPASSVPSVLAWN